MGYQKDENFLDWGGALRMVWGEGKADAATLCEWRGKKSEEGAIPLGSEQLKKELSSKADLTRFEGEGERGRSTKRSASRKGLLPTKFGVISKGEVRILSMLGGSGWGSECFGRRSKQKPISPGRGH